MKLEQARRHALSLPDTHEEPHHGMSSFRVGRRIFATVPPDGAHLHVFVEEEERAPLIAAEPEAYEKLWWGKKVMGVRVTLANADFDTVAVLLESAWRRKAPKALVAAFDAADSGTRKPK
ncbi:MAG TPA: MmcQ/YjbR family DNA-binding protein [Gammaproteobacteria bacterium]